MTDAADQEETHDTYLEVEDVFPLYTRAKQVTGEPCTEEEARYLPRDPGGLEGALGRPWMYFEYHGADLAYQAAILAHGIAEGQYFLDGNKRCASAVMRAFLDINGYSLGDVPQRDRIQWMLGLAGSETVETLAARIRAALVAT